MPFGPVRSAGSLWTSGRVIVLVILVLASSLFLPFITGDRVSPNRPIDATGTSDPTVAHRNLTGGASDRYQAPLTPELSTTAVGSVVRTVFPGFNTSLPGSFTSSVSAWEVGSPAYDPSTGTIWFPQRSISIAGVPLPRIAPAAVFNPFTRGFDQLVTNLSNTSAAAYDSGNGLLYATEPGTDSVTVINPVTAAIVKPHISVGSEPDAIAVDVSSNSVFVANYGSSNLTVIDALDNKVSTSSVPVGANPVALIDDPSDGFIFVANAGGSFISVIKADSPTGLEPTISLFDGPASGFAFSSRTDKLLATISSSNYATIIDAGSLAVVNALLHVGKGVVAGATSGNGTEFILGNASGGDIVVLNSSVGSQVGSTITVDRNATQLVLDPQNGVVYCWTSAARVLESLNLSSNTAIVVTPTTAPQLDSIGSLPGQSRTFASAGNGSLVYVLSSLQLSVVSTRIVTSSPALSLAVSSTSDRLYVGTSAGLEIYNATSDQFINDVSGLSGRDSQFVLDPSENFLWLADSLSGVVAVNLTTNTISLSTGLLPSAGSMKAIAIDPLRSEAFVLVSSVAIAVLNSRTGTVVNPSIIVGSNVTSIAYDPADNQVYVAGDGVSLLNASSLAVDGGPILVGSGHKVLDEIYEPSREEIFIATEGLLAGQQGTVCVLDGMSILASEGSVAEIPVGETPAAFGIVDPARNPVPNSAMVWVANEFSGTISIIASPPVIMSLAANPSPVDLGFPTSIIVTFEGGAGDSKVVYYGLPPGCPSSDTLQLNCTPSATGTFVPAANVTDSFGFSANLTTTLVVVRSLVIQVSFSLTTFPYLDEGIALNGMASASNGIPPYVFSWSFADGGTASGPNASHAYAHTGVYAVTAEVRDSTGASNNSSVAIVVVPPPSAVISFRPGNVTDVNVPVSFVGTVAGGTGVAAQSWTFGDGSGALGSNTTHAWTRPGNYSVKFVYTDALGLTTNRSVEVTVHPSLTATFTSGSASSTNPTSPGTAVLFMSNVSGGTPPYIVAWSFGDGSNASGPSLNHRYASAGTFTVDATLTDAVGADVRTNFSVSVVQNSSSSGGLPSLSSGFESGLFLGLLVGGVLAAAVLYVVGLRKGVRPPTGPVSPYVPP